MTDINKLSIVDAKNLLLNHGFKITSPVELPEHLAAKVDPKAIQSYIETGGTVNYTVLLDTETTGVDESSEIIEISMMRVAYDPTSAEVLGLVDRYDAFNEPEGPITEMITKLTGITPEMVRGQRFDGKRIAEIIEGDETVLIAHGSKFDRGMMERNLCAQIPELIGKRWACSYEGVDWPSGTAKLDYLLFTHGYHYDAHRATEDVNALACLMFESGPLDGGEPYFMRAIRSAYEQTVTIYATNSPFETKDILKKRGFHWNDGVNGKPKAWHITCPGSQVDDILGWLDENVGRYVPEMFKEDGVERYAVIKKPATLRPVM